MPPRCEIHTFLQRAAARYSCIVCPYGMLVLCVGAVGGWHGLLMPGASARYSCIVCRYGMLVLCVGTVGGMAWLIDARGIGTVFLYSVSVRYSCLVCRHGWGDGMAH